MVNERPPILITPVRGAPGFAATLNVTVPLPDPLGPEVIEIHESSVRTFQSHVASDITSTVPGPPAAAIVMPADDSVTLHPLSCLTLKVAGATPAPPDTMTVPLRPSPMFGATASCTVPLPVPPALPVIVIHGTWGTAVHAQVPPVCTLKLAVPPGGFSLTLSGTSVRPHPSLWFTVNVRPAMSIVPDRPAPDVAATVYCTVPVLDPLAPLVMDIQSA